MIILPTPIRRILMKIGYPWHEGVDITDKRGLSTLVCWLEDRKIRFLEIESRKALRSHDDATWNSSFSAYLSQLSCPWTWIEVHRLDCVVWLIHHAVGAEYEELGEYSKENKEESW